MPTQPLLAVKGVTKSYKAKVVLRDINIEVNDGEYVTILGPSGCGKSVLLRLIAGLEEPTAGEIFIGGQNMSGIPAYRRNVGVVFQSMALFPHLKVSANVAYGLRTRRHNGMSADQIQARVDEMIELVGLRGLENRRVKQISGGQQQRVALARTLAPDPHIVLLDEPLGALDANLRATMKVELRKLQRKLGGTFLHVTGNEEEALAMADRLIVLEGGSVAQFARPAEVYKRPGTPEIAYALNRYNLIKGRMEEGGFVGPDFRVALAGGEPPQTGPATYCIGYDQLSILASGDEVPAGHCSIVAKHVAFEFSGSLATYLFTLCDGQHLESQYHLHYRKAVDLREGEEYRLSWPADRALVYAGVVDKK